MASPSTSEHQVIAYRAPLLPHAPSPGLFASRFSRLTKCAGAHQLLPDETSRTDASVVGARYILPATKRGTSAPFGQQVVG